jgi:hypothetical protein
MSNNRPGCLMGFLKLFLLDKAYDWLQAKFGFKRGGCIGFGCGIILLILMIALSCWVISGTDWFQLF